MARSKLSEEAWAALFARDAAGEDRRALAAEHGICVGAIKWQAAKRGLRKSDRPGEAVDRRRRPADGWARDRVHPQSRSGMSEGRWVELLGRRNAGEADADLAAEYGVCEAMIDGAAARLGMRKCETPGAVYRPRGPGSGWATGAGDYRRRTEVVRIEMDWLRAAASIHAFDLRIVERLNGGDEVGASAMWKWRGRYAQMGGVTGAGIRAVLSPSPSWGGMASLGEPGWGRVGGAQHPFGPHPGGCAAVPPHEGEGEGLVLRAEQRAPEGDWRTWLFLGGRGAGKTLAGASWIADMAERCGRLALIGPTLHDAREVMIGGPSGVLALPRWRATGANGTWNGPVYEPSRRRLRFPNGAEAFVFSAEDPESLRGPQFGAAWADEFCAWPKGEETLSLLRMGLRMRGGGAIARLAEPRCLSAENSIGAEAANDRVVSDSPPRLCVTTTPKPTRALKGLMAEGSCVTTRAATADNAANLAPGFLEELQARYGGTRRAAQELEGRVVEAEGSLFTARMMADCRTDETFTPWGRLGVRSSSAERGSAFERVVVGVDPTTTAGGDACGIVVVGRRRRADGRSEAVVLADRSARGLSPDGWARRARTAAEAWGAQVMVVEVNQGGEMVRAVFKAAGCAIPLQEVRAAVGKRARAEPVAALYEQGRVKHAGALDELEEELMALGAGDDAGRSSLDRADALVWAVTALIVAETAPPRARML